MNWGITSAWLQGSLPSVNIRSIIDGDILLDTGQYVGSVGALIRKLEFVSRLFSKVPARFLLRQFQVGCLALKSPIINRVRGSAARDMRSFEK